MAKQNHIASLDDCQKLASEVRADLTALEGAIAREEHISEATFNRPGRAIFDPTVAMSTREGSYRKMLRKLGESMKELHAGVQSIQSKTNYGKN